MKNHHQVLSSFFDELEKIAERQNAAGAAHELGHAQDFEQAHKFRSLVSDAVVGMGIGAAAGGLALGKPLVAAVGGLAASAPKLFYEGTASLRGYKALKDIGMNEQELKTARKHLVTAFGSYAIPVATAAAGLAANTAILKSSGIPADSKLPISALASIGSALLGLYGGKKLSDKFVKDSKELLVDLDKVKELRERMGVKANIYEHGPSEIYIPKGTSEQLIRKTLGKGFPVDQIYREGGVILPKGRYK